MDVSSTSQLDELSYSAFVRALNDDIVALGARDPDEPIQIICECSEPHCATKLEITADEYRAVRADDTRFLMAPGHEDTEVQRVVLRNGATAVVEQHESWVESDPRETSAAARFRPVVLIVDGELEIRELCVTCLQQSGAVVLGASDGQQGLDKARNLRPDLIVTDVAMPVFEGFQLAQALDLDDRTQGIPVIILARESDRRDVATGLELVAHAYITKPLDPDHFTSVVTDALERFAGLERDSAAA